MKTVSNKSIFISFLAKSGDRSTNMPYQAELLMQRLKDQQLCDWDNDWKVITFFVGVSKMIYYLFSIGENFLYLG